MTAAERFGHYGAALNDAPLEASIAHHAKRAVVDWYAALLAGSVLQPAEILARTLAEDLDRGEARLPGGRAATVRTAALINGTASHTAEVDDIYREAIYHPGAPTIAAALALAQARKASGEAFLKAVVAGYEISTRIGEALGREHYRYWHNTGTVGAFGAAAAAASLLRLDSGRYTHALCTAATFAAGLQQAFRMDSMSKPLHAGRAAEAGVLAACAAEHGLTGSLDVLDGEAGMGRAMSGEPDWERVLETLGASHNIGRMTFKNHACCGHTFAPIDGVLALMERMGAGWQEVERVDIATYAPALAVAGNPAPRTAAEARFSIPFVVATAMRHGSVRLAAFTDERLRDQEVRMLMGKVHLSVDPALDARFPRQRAASIAIRTNDGGTGQHLQPTRKGDPDAPLSDEDLSAKYLELACPVLGEEQARERMALLWNLEHVADLRSL